MINTVKRNQEILAVVAIIGLFSLAWLWLASSVPPWSDEITHIQSALGLRNIGDPVGVIYNQCTQVFGAPYYRGLEFTRWVSWSYQLLGESVTAARSVPFIFTIGTWALYAGYSKWRGYLVSKQFIVLTVLFFGQAAILEKALYVRIYAPMLFFMLLSMIGIWESALKYGEKRYLWSIAWIVLAGLAFYLIHTWHLVQFLVLLVSVLALWSLRVGLPVRQLLDQTWQRARNLPGASRYLSLPVLLIAAAIIIILGPRILDSVGVTILGANRVHFSPWDNVFSLLRFAIITNVLIFAWWTIKRVTDSNQNFHHWVIATGIITGLIIAGTMNHSWIFYTRHIYLSAGLVSLGGAALLVNHLKSRHLVAALACYLFINSGLSATTFAFDRSNADNAIDWLQVNTRTQDIILNMGTNIELNPHPDLCEQIISIQSASYVGTGESSNNRGFSFIQGSSGYPYITGDSVIELIEKNPSSDIYFLYTNFHQLRTQIYRWTTGRDRSKSNDLFFLLKQDDVGESVVSGLRWAGLRKLDKAQLVTALEARSFP